MRELIFHVEFLSDIVLPATSNNEGNIVQLDFIPGSNFLGMVAHNYDKFSNSFAVFHSGKARFGDATILREGKQTYKTPLSYFHQKLKEEPIYNHHFLDENDFNILGQLKQLRSGYITKEKEQVFIEYNYVQKSAYDKENRKSKDRQMYGYKAIQSGTKWQFSVKVEANVLKVDEELIITTLESSSRLGKSKSAEYGQVKIVHKPELQRENIESKSQNNQNILYVNSRLALVNEEGAPSFDLKRLCKGLDETKILYEKTQIRISAFTPYNGARQTKDYERVCVNKGSVIVLKDVSPEQLQEIRNGVGAYLSEGFGEILINPEFLLEKKIDIKENSHAEKNLHAKEPSDYLALFLKQREDNKIAKLDVATKVQEFIQNNKIYNEIKNSQWGKIRSICTSGSQNFKQEIREYISSGKVSWEKEQIAKLLDNDSHSPEFIKLLAIHMPKVKNTPKEKSND